MTPEEFQKSTQTYRDPIFERLTESLDNKGTVKTLRIYLAAIGQFDPY